MSLSIIIPLWNEFGNVERLVKELNDNFQSPEFEVILVNNGSDDGTKAKIEDCTSGNKLFRFVNFEENKGYGGGVRDAFPLSNNDWICWIPGDLQIKPDDVKGVWTSMMSYLDEGGNANTIFKGKRVMREDGIFNSLVSKFYTNLGKYVLGLQIEDLNSLPKIFPKRFITGLPKSMRKTFIFDAEMLYYAQKQGYQIKEYPVGWYNRYRGTSSWNGKKIRVYISCFIDIFKLRFFG